MALPKLKLCWNGSRVEADWHLGLFGIYTRGSEGGRPRGVVTSNEADFMARLDELTQAQDFEVALKWVRDARFAKPDWLGARETDLARQEIRFSGRTGDMLALRSAVRLYNTGDRHRSGQLIEIARELNTAERRPEAILVLKELLAKVPDYTLAQRLLAEWSPKPASNTP